MSKIGKLLTFSFLVLIFVACSADRTREEQVGAMIGKIEEPWLIINLTPQNLLDKSGVQDGALPYTYELITGLFIDDSLTGIDYNVKTQAVVGKGQSFTPNFYVIFKIKDEGKFKEMLEKEANAKIKEKEGFTYTIKEGDNFVVVWNEEFAVMSNIPMDFAAMLTGGGGDQGESQVNKNIDLIKAADDAEVDMKYADFLKKEDDISIYYDGAGMYSYLEEMSMGESDELESMKDIYEGMSYEFALNFENGSVDLSYITHLSDELKEDLNFIGDGPIDKKLLSYGNNPNPVLVGTYHVKFTEMFDYLEATLGEDEMEDLDEGLSEVGLSIDEAKTALSGEAMYVIDRIETKEVTWDFGYGDPYTYTTTEPVFGVALRVSNRSVIEKAMKSMMEMTGGESDVDLADVTMETEEIMAILEEMEETAYGPEIEEQANGVIRIDEAYIHLGKDVLFASNDSAWAQKVATGKGAKIKDPKGTLGKDPFGIYANFASLAKMENLNDARVYVNLFKDFSGAANLDAGSFSLALKDDSKNALRILTEVVSDELNKMEQRMNPDLMEEFEDAVEVIEEEEEMGCEAGACEAGACEGGACEGGE